MQYTETGNDLIPSSGWEGTGGSVSSLALRQFDCIRAGYRCCLLLRIPQNRRVLEQIGVNVDGPIGGF
jgi:hypothetical protein